MTVGQLIVLLQSLPPELVVWVHPKFDDVAWDEAAEVRVVQEAEGDVVIIVAKEQFDQNDGRYRECPPLAPLKVIASQVVAQP